MPDETMNKVQTVELLFACAARLELRVTQASCVVSHDFLSGTPGGGTTHE